MGIVSVLKDFVLGTSAFSYVNKKNVTWWLHAGKSHTVTLYYFTKLEDKSIPLPKGYYVVENQTTGLPVLKKEKLG